EFELNSASAIATPLVKSTARLSSPFRRRLKSARLIPIRAELIVFLPLLRIAQYFVGFIDLLEFFFRGFFILCDFGMIFAREFPECPPDLVVSRRFGNAERLIIISELYRHRMSTLCLLLNSATFTQDA